MAIVVYDMERILPMDYLAQKATITGDSYAAEFKEAVQKTEDRRQRGWPDSS
jgi:hypothetical protein